MAIDMLKIREIALRRYKNQTNITTEEELIDFLKLWWTNRYNLPDNHPLFLERTLEEHVLDYYLDYFSKNPNQGTIQTKEELEAEEEAMRKEMGDDFTPEYSYFLPPSTDEKSGEAVRTELPDDIDESFEDS